MRRLTKKDEDGEGKVDKKQGSRVHEFPQARELIRLEMKMENVEGRPLGSGSRVVVIVCPLMCTNSLHQPHNNLIHNPVLHPNLPTITRTAILIPYICVLLSVRLYEQYP